MIREFPISVKVSECANGETHEYRLMVGDVQAGPSVFQTVLVGDSHAAHAAVALRNILDKVEVER